MYVEFIYIGYTNEMVNESIARERREIFLDCIKRAACYLRTFSIKSSVVESSELVEICLLLSVSKGIKLSVHYEGYFFL